MKPLRGKYPRTYTIPEENKVKNVLDEIPVPKMKMRSQ